MKFSVIMPSRLIPYHNCAQFLDQKIVRAINSVLNQTYKDFELIVIADECELTKEIVNSFSDARIKLLECKHKQVFDNTPRNTGIENASGDYIIYIDADDYWGENHLAIVESQLKNHDWVYFNDYFFHRGEEWGERACNVRILGGCGTSNICHKRSLGLKWDRPGYAHDYHFIQKLRNYPNNIKINTPEYWVMHAPGIYDL